MDKHKHYKLIYLDTNVASNISKVDTGDKLILKYLQSFPPNEDYLLCFSTYTLYEIQKSSEHYDRFKKVFSLFPCAIVMSYFPLADKEYNKLIGAIDDVSPIMFAPVGIEIEGKRINPDSLDKLLSRPEVEEGFKTIDKYVNIYLEEFSVLMDHKDFRNLKNNLKGKVSVFVKRFLKYELVKRFYFEEDRDVDFIKIMPLKSLNMFAYCTFYKLFSDSKRNIVFNDIIDILIMTTIPYVHTFISEANSIDVLKKIKRQTHMINSVKLVTYKEFKNVDINKN